MSKIPQSNKKSNGGFWRRTTRLEGAEVSPQRVGTMGTLEGKRGWQLSPPSLECGSVLHNHLIYIDLFFNCPQVSPLFSYPLFATHTAPREGVGTVAAEVVR